MTLFKGRIWFCGLPLHSLKAVQVPARRTEEDKRQTLLLSPLQLKCSAGAWGYFCHDKKSAAHTSPIPGTIFFLFTRLKAHPGLPEGSRSTAEVSVPVPLYPPSPSRVCWAHPQHRWFTSASPPSARCLQLVIWPLPVQQTSQFTWLSRVTSIQPYGVKLLFLAGFSLLEEAYLLPVPSLKDGSSTRGCNQASSCLWIPYWPLSPFISAARLIRRAVLPPPGMQTGRGANLKALCARHFVTSRL